MNIKLAFTLAEVLIVLGIIGLIADMTIPTLTQSYEKRVVVTKLQKFYSSMTQAISLAETANGNMDDWTYVDMEQWFNDYLGPHMSVLRTEKIDNEHVWVYFNDGTVIFMIWSGGIDIRFYTKNVKNPVAGKQHFVYMIHRNSPKRLRAYDWLYDEVPIEGEDLSKFTREVMTRKSGHGCSKQGDKNYCAALIQYDGWKISDDYPW